MKKRLIAGTMALALMAGQFNMVAFADSKEKKTVAKPVIVKAQMVKSVSGKNQLQAIPLTEKELEELMKNLKTSGTVTIGKAVKDVTGKVVDVYVIEGTEIVPAANTVPAKLIETAPQK